MATYGSGSGGTPPEDEPRQGEGGYAPPPSQPQQTGPGPQPTQYGTAPGYVPPPGGPQVGVPVVPPKKRSPLLIIGIIVLVLVVLCALGGVGLFGAVMNATQPMANAGETYMTALRDGDYTKAYDLSATPLQQQVSNAQGLQAALSSKQPASWSFTSRNISSGQGTLSGTTTYKDATTGTVDMVLTQVGNDWKVAGVTLK